MVFLLWLLTAALIQSDAKEVRLDDSRWVIDDESSSADRIWRWSSDCAPQELRLSTEKAHCAATRAVALSVIDRQRRPVNGALVQWGTEEMLRDIPDARLPAVTISEGAATVAVPAGADVWMRVAGPQIATHWRRVPARESLVRFEAAPAARMRLRLRGDDGMLVSRAHIVLLPMTCSTICPERLLALGDANTPGQMTAVAGSSYRFVTWSDSHAPVEQVVTATGEDLDVLLPRGAALLAHILGRDRKPLRNARLETEFRLPSLRQGIRRKSVTAEDGSVRIGGLPAGPVEWTAMAAGHARRVEAAQMQNDPRDLGEIVLSAARRARLIVMGRDGVPVPNARVIARGSAAAVTDAKGIVGFSELPDADVDLQVEADGFLRAQSMLPADASQLRITLDRGATVKASLIRESDGKAPGRLQVRITNNGKESLRAMDGAGGLVVSGLAPGTVRLRIMADAAQTFDSGMISVGDEAVADLGVVTLKSGIVVRGTIAGERGTPVSGARVRALHTDGDFPALAHVLGNWREAASGDDGSFAIAGLTRDTQILVVDAPGFAQRVLTNLAAGADSNEIDLGNIELRTGVRVALSCRPAARCGTEARLLLAGDEFPFLSIRTPLNNGAGTFHAAPGGEATLRLTRNEHVVYEQRVAVNDDVESQKLEITLPSVRVYGHVTLGGEAARGGSLLLTRQVRGSSIPILIRSQTGTGSAVATEWLGSFGAAAAADVTADGSFSVDDVQPGDYEVAYRNGSGSSAPIRVNVADVSQQTLDLRFDVHQIAGVVLDAAGHPAAARLTILDGLGMTHDSASGVDGRFEVLGLSAGRARVKATASGRFAEAAVDVSGQAAKNLTLHLTDEEPGITVTVSEAVGNPASGVLVFLMTGKGLLTSSSDHEGRAVFHASAENGAMVAAHRPGGGWAFGTPSGAATLRLSLPPLAGSVAAHFSSSCAASVIAPNGFPLQEVLPMVGVSTSLPAGGTLRLTGLPPATYTFVAGMLRKNVSVSAGKTAVVEFR